MGLVKVTRNYQVTIPADVRKRAKIKEGDLVDVEYDEKEGVIKIRKVGRKKVRIKLGRPLSPEKIEKLIEDAADEITSGY